MDIFAADVTLSVDENGVPRINIGDAQTGVGFGASVALWGSGDGFVSMPNAPDGASCAQALVLVEGNTKRALALRDNRWIGAAGTLAEGDRAIVSDSEAWFLLTRSQHRIRLRSEHSIVGELLVDVNGSAGTIKLSVGPVTLTINEAGMHLTSTAGVPVITVNTIPLQVP